MLKASGQQCASAGRAGEVLLTSGWWRIAGPGWGRGGLIACKAVTCMYDGVEAVTCQKVVQGDYL